GEAEREVTLAEIESRKCECGVRQIDCDECRYELGVVKMQPSVSQALVSTAKVQQGDLTQVLRVTGEVQLDRTRVVEILPAAPGRVTSIRARLGQQVKQGDVLAVIHSSELGEAEAAYLEAWTALEIAAKEQERQVTVNAALEKLLERLARTPDASQGSAAAGDSVVPAELLGEWRSKLIGAAASLQKARSVHEREKALLPKQASSQAEYEEAQRELRTTQADYAALVEEVHLNLQLARLRADNAVRQAEAKCNAVAQRLRLFGLDAETITSVAHLKENGRFASLEVKAPRSGTVTVQDASQGRFVDATHSLFTIGDLSNLWVWCDLYERDLAALHGHLGQGKNVKANVRVLAFRETVFSGVVDLVGSAVDEHTRTVKVRVQLANAEGMLKPGMFANVEIELPTDQRAVLAPRQAILTDAGKAFAFQHWKDDLWLRRDVVVGRTQGDHVEIVRGLEPGVTIATKAVFMFKSDVLRAKMGAGCAD
ncbi:MAG: efflux RND transporter periplasmic adaptor subunit, partial [Gemmatimonadales bacterium]